MAKEFLMHCDYCGRKVVVRDPTGINGLKEMPLAPIPGGVPELDPVEKKVKAKKSIPRRRMFKCSVCGRGIMLRQNMVPLSEDFKEQVSEEKDISVGRKGSIVGPEVQGNSSSEPFARRSKIHEQPWMRLQPSDLSQGDEGSV